MNELQTALDATAAKLGYYRWQPFVASTRSVGKYSWHEPRLCPIGPTGPVCYYRNRRNGLNPVAGPEGTAHARWLTEAAVAASAALENKYYTPEQAATVLSAACDLALRSCHLTNTSLRNDIIQEAAATAVCKLAS